MSKKTSEPWTVFKLWAFILVSLLFLFGVIAGAWSIARDAQAARPCSGNVDLEQAPEWKAQLLEETTNLKTNTVSNTDIAGMLFAQKSIRLRQLHSDLIALRVLDVNNRYDTRERLSVRQLRASTIDDLRAAGASTLDMGVVWKRPPEHLGLGFDADDPCEFHKMIICGDLGYYTIFYCDTDPDAGDPRGWVEYQGQVVGTIACGEITLFKGAL